MKILSVIGTRPEAIKMGVLIKLLEKTFGKNAKVCVTTQHMEMLKHPLKLFKIPTDYNLHVMKKGQSLNQITSRVLIRMRKVLLSFSPDLVVLQGDTTTAAATAMAAFYLKIPIAHVEAGLRSHSIYQPWPEEFNRKLISIITEMHFAPTRSAFNALVKENINKDRIYITGNTVIDALFHIKNLISTNKELASKCDKYFHFLNHEKKLILVTAHRRESFGEPLKQICLALSELAKRDDIQIVYPVHLNEHVQNIVYKYLAHQRNIYLIKPQSYLNFVYLFLHSYFILTDSGGIQEEAPSIGKPVLIMRDVTERVEAVEEGVARLVGTDKDKIISASNELLEDKVVYDTMARKINIYGDGKASERILEHILNKLKNKTE